MRCGAFKVLCNTTDDHANQSNDTRGVLRHSFASIRVMSQPRPRLCRVAAHALRVREGRPLPGNSTVSSEISHKEHSDARGVLSSVARTPVDDSDQSSISGKFVNSVLATVFWKHSADVNIGSTWTTTRSYRQTCVLCIGSGGPVALASLDDVQALEAAFASVDSLDNTYDVEMAPRKLWLSGAVKGMLLLNLSAALFGSNQASPSLHLDWLSTASIAYRLSGPSFGLCKHAYQAFACCAACRRTAHACMYTGTTVVLETRRRESTLARCLPQVVIKLAEADMSPATLSALRFGIAALCFAPAAFRGAGKPQLHATALELGCWLFGGYMLQAWGLEYTTASRGAFTGTFTVLAVPMLVGLSGRRVPWSTWAAAAVALTGEAACGRLAMSVHVYVCLWLPGCWLANPHAPTPSSVWALPSGASMHGMEGVQAC